jgi:hypothetical protein
MIGNKFHILAVGWLFGGRSGNQIRSAAPAGRAAGGGPADDCSQGDSENDGLIGVFQDASRRGVRLSDALVFSAADDEFAPVESVGHPFAGLGDFFAGDIGGGGEERARIFGELFQVVAERFCMFVHNEILWWFSIGNSSFIAAAAK